MKQGMLPAHTLATRTWVENVTLEIEPGRRPFVLLLQTNAHPGRRYRVGAWPVIADEARTCGPDNGKLSEPHSSRGIAMTPTAVLPVPNLSPELLAFAAEKGVAGTSYRALPR